MIKPANGLRLGFGRTALVCRHCGNADVSRIAHLNGKAHRPGVYQCAECRQQFTVTVGTVFESSKIPLSKWMAALFMMVSSKKGVSAHQMHRMLSISYKSTWFMMHRLREAMREGGLAPIGGEGAIVEYRLETYIGRKGGAEIKAGYGHKISCPRPWLNAAAKLDRSISTAPRKTILSRLSRRTSPRKVMS